MYSSGVRGLCPACLFACTTGRLAGSSDSPGPGDDTVLESGEAVGPNGRFRLLDKLGEGGMGEVWLANDRELSQENEPHFVALKFLSKSIRHDPLALSAIRAEVLRSQKLSHPNIVRIFDLHTTVTGMPFIKMEFVDGNSVSQWLERRHGHVMPWRMTVQLVQQMCGALRYAHETAGIVHCDFKPSNLLLAEGPTFKLSDFGIAHAMHDRSATGEVAVLGTLCYASPQQVAGRRPTPADDIYSLGATLYEVLTGSPPFAGDSAEDLIQKVYYESPEAIPQRLVALGRRNEIPGKLLVLAQRCLEKDPIYRPKTSEIVRLLPAVEEVPLDRNYGLPLPEQRSKQKAAKGKSPFVLAGLSTICLAVGVLIWWRSASEKGGPLPPGPDRPKPPIEIFDPPPPPPIPPPDSGIFIRVTPVDSRKKQAHELIILRSGEMQRSVSGPLPIYPMERFVKLPPDSYSVIVTVDDDWRMQETVKISSNETTNIDFLFNWSSRLKVTSDPPGTTVEWWDSREQRMLKETRPFFEHHFRTGRLEFSAKAPGYHTITTNFHFNPAVRSQLHIRLVKSTYPLPAEPWTNSLGMAFQWIDPLKLWACETETRVRDFRRFVEANPPQSRNQIWTVISATMTNLEDFSWEQPGFGFNQTDHHPVVGVNWEDATQFCAWLTRTERATNGLTNAQAYRLPKTNHWFRLAGDWRFPWGDDPNKVAGNYAGKEVAGAMWRQKWHYLTNHIDVFQCTAPVYAHEFQTNAFGLHHMGGNAAEWCAEKVLCGGSWNDPHGKLMSFLETRRPQTPPGLSDKREQIVDPRRRDARYGFRVIIVPDDSAYDSK